MRERKKSRTIAVDTIVASARHSCHPPVKFDPGAFPGVTQSHFACFRDGFRFEEILANCRSPACIACRNNALENPDRPSRTAKHVNMMSQARTAKAILAVQMRQMLAPQEGAKNATLD
ncbi:MAG: hypothetical protein KBE19_04535 [Rhodocyclaceae bacterium]|nr:hypothetical protein [Rhodocyclaceae bacterium]